MKRSWILGAAAALLVVAGVTLCVLRFVVAPDADASRNTVASHGPHVASEAATRLHHEAFVADLHADPLLWGRDLASRGTRGHIDVPRLRESGVDLQVFGVVTKVPKGMNVEHNAGDSDRLPLLFVGTWRGPSTWFSPRGRALAQARELHALARRTDLVVVRTRSDLTADGTKGLLALEGLHALEGDAAAFDTLYEAGFRMVGLAHFFDNEAAGSAHGVERYGLTPLGRDLVPRMEARGVTLDLAHASPLAFDEALALATKPVVVSHTGVKGTCPGTRNLSDAQLRAIAQNGGVVGIGFWDTAVCDTSTTAIVAAIRYAADVASVDHVGLGSDFDGSVHTPWDVTGLVLVTQGLLDAGMPEDDVRKVLGGNVRRVLEANLPP